MLYRAQWFTANALPTPDTWAELELDGIGEWNDSVPPILYALLGVAPTVCIWQLDTDSFGVIHACARSDAVRRLARLITATTHAPITARSRSALADAARLLGDSARSHFCLMTTELAVQSKRTNALTSVAATLWANQISAAAALWCSRLTGADQSTADTLALIETLNRQPGAWTPLVLDGMAEFHDSSPPELPDVISALIEDRSAPASRYTISRFEPQLEAYRVSRQRDGASPLEGLITHYGRWLTEATHAHAYALDNATMRTTPIVVSATANDGHVTGLLSSNGIPLLECAYSYISGTGVLITAQTGEDNSPNRRVETFRIEHPDGPLRRLPYTAAIHYQRDEDSLCEAAFTTFDGTALSGPNRIGLVTEIGDVVVRPRFSEISPFNKAAGVAIVGEDRIDANGELQRWFGLLNRADEIVLPLQYSAIGRKLRNGPPHFCKKSCVIERPNPSAEVRCADPFLGIATTKGHVVLEPDGRYERFHLAWTLDKDGAILAFDVPTVKRDNKMQRQMFRAFHDGRVESLHMTWREMAVQLGLVRDDGGLSLQQAFISTSVDDDAVLTRTAAEEALAAMIVSLISDAADRDEVFPDGFEHTLREQISAVADGESVRRGDLTPLLDDLIVTLRDAGYLIHIDWKAVDEITHASAHLSAHARMSGFTWDGIANGEGMDTGILAIGAHAAANGLVAFEYQDGSDSHHIGVVDASQRSMLDNIAARLQLPIVWVQDT